MTNIKLFPIFLNTLQIRQFVSFYGIKNVDVIKRKDFYFLKKYIILYDIHP